MSSITADSIQVILDRLHGWAPQILKDLVDDSLAEEQLKLEFVLSWLSGLIDALTPLSGLTEVSAGRAGFRYTAAGLIMTFVSAALLTSASNLQRCLEASLRVLFAKPVAQQLIERKSILIYLIRSVRSNIKPTLNTAPPLAGISRTGSS